MPEKTFTIDPDARLDFPFNWAQGPNGSTGWLHEGETIDTYEVTATDGITVDSDSEDGGIVTVWVSGATGRYQRITCHIVSSEGREDDRTIKLIVRSR